MIDRKGKIEILQLSGGEPTLHPRLFELCAWLKQHSQIDFVLLNTNGVLLARDPRFAHEFMRGTPLLAAGMTGYQILSLVTAALGAWMFLRRRRRAAP